MAGRENDATASRGACEKGGLKSMTAKRAVEESATTCSARADARGWRQATLSRREEESTLKTRRGPELEATTACDAVDVTLLIEAPYLQEDQSALGRRYRTDDMDAKGGLTFEQIPRQSLMRRQHLDYFVQQRHVHKCSQPKWKHRLKEQQSSRRGTDWKR